MEPPQATGAWVELGACADLADGGVGLRFEVLEAGRRLGAFAVRHGGVVHAYLNRCAHVAMELDWQPGRFFDGDGALLMCSTHAALYDPASGSCAGGACRGRGGLVKLEVEERAGRVWWRPHGVYTALPPG